MSASFHPGDELLFAYGAGSTDQATALLVATHLALCPRCRDEVAMVESLGGGVLENLPPVAMNDGALATILSRIESEPVIRPTAFRAAPPRPAPRDAAMPLADPPGFPEPLRSLAGDDPGSVVWRRLSSGIDQAILVESGATKARLLRIAPGSAIPLHGHRGIELTMVLQGGFGDGRGHYRPGDVCSADCETEHQVTADEGEPCICLVVTDAAPKLLGVMGRLISPFVKW